MQEKLGLFKNFGDNTGLKSKSWRKIRKVKRIKRQRNRNRNRNRGRKKEGKSEN